MAATPQAKGKGRKSGAKGWRPAETDLLLDLIEEHKPCGPKQWENVAADMYVEKMYNRTGDGCKKKFDRLWSQPKPTGSAEVPRHVVRALDVNALATSTRIVMLTLMTTMRMMRTMISIPL